MWKKTHWHLQGRTSNIAWILLPCGKEHWQDGGVLLVSRRMALPCKDWAAESCGGCKTPLIQHHQEPCSALTLSTFFHMDRFMETEGLCGTEFCTTNLGSVIKSQALCWKSFSDEKQRGRIFYFPQNTGCLAGSSCRMWSKAIDCQWLSFCSLQWSWPTGCFVMAHPY